MTNYKGRTGASMGVTSIKPEHLRKKSPKYSYKSYLNSPVKVTKADGTVTIEEALTGQQIAAAIKKGKKNNQSTGVIMPNPATEKQMALIKKYNMPVHSDTLTVKEASAIIDTFAKANGWGQKPYTPKAKAEPTPMPDSF
jgi:hypothetical protein